MTFQGNDLVLELAFLGGLPGQLVRAVAELVLGLAGDAEAGDTSAADDLRSGTRTLLEQLV